MLCYVMLCYDGCYQSNSNMLQKHVEARSLNHVQAQPTSSLPYPLHRIPYTLAYPTTTYQSIG